MTRLAGSRDARYHYTGAPSADFTVFSPNGKYFVIVTRKGNLEANTNEYSLLLFQTDSIFSHPNPKTLASFTSSSDREGITDVSWLEDNDTIFFLGEHPGETSQLYSLHCKSGKIEQVSHQERSVIAYAVSSTGDRIALGVENPTANLLDAKALRNGIRVSSEDALQNLIVGRAQTCCQTLLAWDKGGSGTKALAVAHGKVWDYPLDLLLSPNGRYLVVMTDLTDVPDAWGRYSDEDLKRAFSRRPPKGGITFFTRYELIDIETGISRILIDSPIGFTGSEVSWSPDSHSVIVTGVFLPLDVQDPTELAARQARPFPVEVKIPSLETVKVTDHDMKMIGWDLSKTLLKFRPRPDQNAPLEYYRKAGSQWEKVASISDSSAISDLPVISVEQDLNLPPRVIAKDPKTDRKAIVLKLNPQFDELTFGKVEQVKWIAGGGKEVMGGLYLPPDYQPGKRYPLVIQTHGFDPHGFWADGPFSSGFAAQPLANKQIVVLQIPDNHESRSTPAEALLMMQTYEHAIDFLDARGLIDRTRVGIIGFSRTSLYIKYMLTHSTYHLAAASVSDGVDTGYFQYVEGETSIGLSADADSVIGAPPFGEGLALWLKRSPGFLLDKVSTPVRILAHGGFEAGGILTEWEWFAGLTRLGKPVELIYLPEGTHILQKPAERLISQQGNVDWFCFWLKGEEDTDPSKVDQYSSWRELRERLAREANHSVQSN
jgi:hypothetical protein